MSGKQDVVSVIIPTLNEAVYLPRLLEALQAQVRLADEIIVADAGSTDGTVALAQAAGARIVPGGRPAAGRNAGARSAQGDLLLFLDADVVPAPNFVGAALEEFHAGGFDVAAPLVAPLSQRRIDLLLCEITNLLLQMVQEVAPHAGGFCIFARRQTHEAIRGFDETALMAEDHDYVQRAARLGKFGMLTSVQIPVSVRRLEKEGIVQLAAKYLYCEMFALTGQPVRWMPFAYTFGSFSEQEHRPLLLDVGVLRKQLGHMANPLVALGDHGHRVLRSMGSLRLDADAFEETVQTLLPEEVRLLRWYVLRRLVLLRRAGRPLLRQAQHSLDPAQVREHLALLDPRWWLSQRSGASPTLGTKRPAARKE